MEIEEKNPLIDHVIISIFGLLKTHIKLLLSTNKKDEEIYNNVKILIIKCLKDKYLKMTNPSYTVRKTISDSLTLLILSGVFYHWPTCIEDLINESMKENIEFCYIVLRALGSIDLLIHYNRKNTKEEYDDSIIISQKEKMQIKDKLVEKKELVVNFILNIYQNINNIQDENLKKIIIKQLFETTRCWTTFDLNLLKSKNVSGMIYSILNSNFLENPENFSNMIIESINNSNNSKIYKNICVDKNSTIEKISKELSKSIDYKEKEGIDILLNFLFPKLEELKNNTNNFSNNYEKLLLEYAKILASIIENYIYLFFNFKDEKSGMILSWLQYFLKCKKRNISWLFFEGLDEMREFINNYYKFSGLNNQQKIEFVNYLMDIVYGVMENCSYKKLDQNDTSLLEQEIICRNINIFPDPLKSINNANENKIEDLEGCDDIVDINQYRSNAESVFYNIFFIIIENFQDPGTSQFLSKIISSLPINEINEQKNLNDQFLPIKIDIILYVITSIFDIFEVEEAPNTINIIHNLIKVFLGSKIVLQNQRIFIDFIILINKFSEKLVLQQENLNNVIQFLISISKRSNNSRIIESCYVVLLNICDEINDEVKIDTSYIKEIFNLYKDIYNKYHYPNLKPLENVIDILLKISGISSKRIPEDKIGPEDNNDYDKNLKYLIQEIYLSIHNGIKNLFEKVEHNNNQDVNLRNYLRLEIVKGYILQGRILSSLKEFSIALRNDYLQEYLNKSLDLTKKIFELFKDDKDLINILIDFFKVNAQAIGEHCHSSFNLFNNIMINYFLSSKTHYKVIDILRLLYLSLIISIDKTDKLYMQINKFILDQYNLIMSTFIDNISKENNINSSLNDTILIISDFHYYIFPKLYVNSSPLIKDNDLIKYYNLIQNVINFFINCINLFKSYELTGPIDEITLISVIKSFNSFFINFSMPKYFITQINHNNSCSFIELIISLWNVILFKQFNCLSRKELINCYNNAIKYEINLFNIAFEKCVSQCPKFSAKYIKSIIEYIQCFEDNTDNITKMLELVIENTQGNAELDIRTFGFLFTLVSRKKGLKKINK